MNVSHAETGNDGGTSLLHLQSKDMQPGDIFKADHETYLRTTEGDVHLRTGTLLPALRGGTWVTKLEGYYQVTKEISYPTS